MAARRVLPARARGPIYNIITSDEQHKTITRKYYLLPLQSIYILTYYTKQELDVPRFFVSPPSYPLQGIDKGIPREHHEEPAIPYILTPMADHHLSY